MLRGQQVDDPTLAAAGGMVLTMSLPVAESSIADGVEVRRITESGAELLGGGEVAIGRSASAPEQVLVLPLAGWDRDATYQITLRSVLIDQMGRPFAEETSIELLIPQGNSAEPAPPIRIDRPYLARHASDHQGMSGLTGDRLDPG
jgi:hypothetical protein